MTEPIRVGIAGYGIVGRKRHHFLSADPNFIVSAICDKTLSSNTVSDPSISTFTDYQSLLSCPIDAIFVCLSNDMAAEVTLRSLEQNLHVFCEKPPARNLTELQPILVQEKSQNKLKLKYGFNHRYHQSVIEALDIVSSGDMGRVINIRGVYGKSNLITFDQTDWRTKRSIAGGGILLDQGIHMVDLVRLFGGQYQNVFSFISNDYWKYDVEDNAYALMKSDSGVVAMLHSSATQWQHKFRLEIGLERGLLTLSGILSGSQSYGRELLSILYTSNSNEPHESQVQHEYTSDNSWADEIADFAADIQLNRPVSTGSSLDALETMELITRIYDNDQS